jgi:hypothetical protein
VSVDPAKALSQGLKPDAVRKSVMEQAAQRDVAEDIVAQTPRQEGPAVSPLVSAAKRKAKIA